MLNILKHPRLFAGLNWFIMYRPDLLQCRHVSLPDLTWCHSNQQPGCTGAPNRNSENYALSEVALISQQSA